MRPRVNDCKIKCGTCLEDLDNILIEELSLVTFYCGGSHWIKPSITTDIHVNVSCGVEMHNLWVWSRCACHVVHFNVQTTLNSPNIRPFLYPMIALCTKFHRYCIEWKKFEAK